MSLAHPGGLAAHFFTPLCGHWFAEQEVGIHLWESSRGDGDFHSKQTHITE